MNNDFYLGPYIEINDASLSKKLLYEFGHDSRHRDLLGEVSSEFGFIGPSLPVPGLDRQRVFDKYTCEPFVSLEITPGQREAEVVKFIEFSKSIIRDLDDKGAEYDVKWGMVRGVF